MLISKIMCEKKFLDTGWVASKINKTILKLFCAWESQQFFLNVNKNINTLLDEQNTRFLFTLKQKSPQTQEMKIEAGNTSRNRLKYDFYALKLFIVKSISEKRESFVMLDLVRLKNIFLSKGLIFTLLEYVC